MIVRGNTPWLAIAIDLCLIWAVLSLDIMMILAAVGALAVAAGLSVLGYALVRNAVSISLQKRNLTPLAPLPIDVMGRIALLMGPVQLCYFVGCVKAIAAKVVKWRGIEYRILDNCRGQIRRHPNADDLFDRRFLLKVLNRRQQRERRESLMQLCS